MDCSGPRRSSRPRNSSTRRPRHPGGRWKSQLNRTRVPPSSVSVSVRCSSSSIPNGKCATRSIQRRSGSRSRTSIVNVHLRPSAGPANRITCPEWAGPGGTALTKAASVHSVQRSGSAIKLHTLSGGALVTAAGHTLTIRLRVSSTASNRGQAACVQDRRRGSRPRRARRSPRVPRWRKGLRPAIWRKR